MSEESNTSQPEDLALFQVTLEKARSFDIAPIIRRFANQRNISFDRASVVADEMLRYLALSTTDTEQGLTVTGEVDEMWHTFILFTQRYNDFCKAIGTDFIHHTPAEEKIEHDPTMPVVEKDLFESYSKTLNKYQRYLGHPADTTIWRSPTIFNLPRTPKACDSGGGSTPEVCACKTTPAPERRL